MHEDTENDLNMEKAFVRVAYALGGLSTKDAESILGMMELMAVELKERIGDHEPGSDVLKE